MTITVVRIVSVAKAHPHIHVVEPVWIVAVTHSYTHHPWRYVHGIDPITVAILGLVIIPVFFIFIGAVRGFIIQ